MTYSKNGLTYQYVLKVRRILSLFLSQLKAIKKDSIPRIKLKLFRNNKSIEGTTKMNEIISTSNTLGGKPRIEGTRVSAEQVYEMYSIREMKPSEIAKELPTIDLEDVEAAIEYMKRYREDEAVRA